MQVDIQQQVGRILELLQEPWWGRLDFWLGLGSIAVGIAGLFYAIRAFKEARLAKEEAERAKQAATEAGKTVRIQTVVIELAEIAQKLDRLQPDVRFRDARELCNEISRRLRRSTSPFADEPEFQPTITAVRQALDAAQASLKGVRPTNPANEDEAPGVVYTGIEADFGAIGNLVADLLGLFEKHTLDPGVKNAKL